MVRWWVVGGGVGWGGTLTMSGLIARACPDLIKVTEPVFTNSCRSCDPRALRRAVAEPSLRIVIFSRNWSR